MAGAVDKKQLINLAVTREFRPFIFSVARCCIIVALCIASSGLKITLSSSFITPASRLCRTGKVHSVTSLPCITVLCSVYRFAID